MTPKNGPLQDVRIIDMTGVGMGPYATQILGDMGADVIKVESPEGDIFRYAAPMKNPRMGATFLNLNRNKRSIVLRLKDEQDRAVLCELIADADILVFNARPQVMRKYDLDYEKLAARNPRLIYCGAYGFSEKGAYRGRPAFDDIIQGMSGMAALQGRSSDDVPRYVNTIVADKVVGLTVAYALAMALFERSQSGQGQAIEVPMFETMVSFNLIEHLGGETFSPPTGGMGYERLLNAWRKPYRTSNGYVSFLPYTSAHWSNFFRLAGHADLMQEPRFADSTSRSQNISELYQLLEKLLRQRSTEEWTALFKDADLPFSPVATPEDLLSDPHLQEIDFFQEVAHPSEGKLKTLGIPVQFSRTPGTLRRPAPQLDEHRAEILQELAKRKAAGRA